ncbi:hypothetical protein PoB_005825200 [Plakobranchus ocellatus]|uniref:Uncharacterized protein n=1 Tax=Plakobranchus ocellatus TaxID=259542 RepID=A0AAV4CJQ3_9GAST|nr:hypothetical protein PoB_005825200 [Plakobranchus ocellatus]
MEILSPSTRRKSSFLIRDILGDPGSTQEMSADDPPMKGIVNKPLLQETHNANTRQNKSLVKDVIQSEKTESLKTSDEFPLNTADVASDSHIMSKKLREFAERECSLFQNCLAERLLAKTQGSNLESRAVTDKNDTIGFHTKHHFEHLYTQAKKWTQDVDRNDLYKQDNYIKHNSPEREELLRSHGSQNGILSQDGNESASHFPRRSASSPCMEFKKGKLLVNGREEEYNNKKTVERGDSISRISASENIIRAHELPFYKEDSRCWISEPLVKNCTIDCGASITPSVSPTYTASPPRLLSTSPTSPPTAAATTAAPKTVYTPPPVAFNNSQTTSPNGHHTQHGQSSAMFRSRSGSPVSKCSPRLTDHHSPPRAQQLPPLPPNLVCNRPMTLTPMFPFRMGHQPALPGLAHHVTSPPGRHHRSHRLTSGHPFTGFPHLPSPGLLSRGE